MSHINPLFLPTLMLALSLFAAGYLIAIRRSSKPVKSVWSAFAAVVAVPGILFVVYYSHLLDHSDWFYAVRTMRYSELAAAGLGLAPGLIAGALRRYRRRSARPYRYIIVVLISCLTLLLSAPYLGPMIVPNRVPFLNQWHDGVCVQSVAAASSPACAATLLRRFGKSASEGELAGECFCSASGTDIWYIARGLRRRGLDVHYTILHRIPYTILPSRPTAIPLPSIAAAEPSGQRAERRFITILGQMDGRYIVGDPLMGRLVATPDQLRTHYNLTGLFLVAEERRTASRNPGGDAAWTDRYALHGAIHVDRYRSRTLGLLRRLHVYTPPGYDPTSSRLYPVLYLLHGSPGDDANWTAYGDVNATLEDLATSRKCVPFIIVMPECEVPRRRYGPKGFEHDLLNDIIPWVEANYRARSDPESRAIAGNSMGGFQSIEIGLNHLDTFRWIGVFSAGLREGFVTERDITALMANPKEAVSRLKLLYVRIGKQDFLLRDARHLDAWLNRKAVPHIYQEVEGSHEWPVWRGALADLAPRLFTTAQR